MNDPVKLPNNENTILIMFRDDLSPVMITTTHLLWDMLKNLTDQELVFTRKEEGYEMKICVTMDKVEEDVESN